MKGQLQLSSSFTDEEIRQLKEEVKDKDTAIEELERTIADQDEVEPTIPILQTALRERDAMIKAKDATIEKLNNQIFLGMD